MSTNVLAAAGIGAAILGGLYVIINSKKGPVFDLFV